LFVQGALFLPLENLLETVQLAAHVLASFALAAEGFVKLVSGGPGVTVLRVPRVADVLRLPLG
jgi:hypothetical protein